MIDPAVAELSSAHDVSELLRSLYGFDPGGEAGLLHVVAVWRPGNGDDQTVMRIVDATPKSRLDARILDVARARSEAILTSGEILRQEPELRHEARADPIAAALEEWRRERTGLEEPPLVVVLTSGENLPLDHPVFERGARTLVFTSEAAAEVLRGRLTDQVQIVGHPEPGPRSAVLHLQNELGLERITVEAGPTTALRLYGAPPLVDELWLSAFLEPRLPRGVAGGGFLAVSQLTGRFTRVTEVSADEESGRWVFGRWRRRPGRPWRPGGA